MIISEGRIYLYFHFIISLLSDLIWGKKADYVRLFYLFR